MTPAEAVGWQAELQTMSRLEAFRAKLAARRKLVLLASVVALGCSCATPAFGAPVFGGEGGTDCTSSWQTAFASPGACGYPDPAYGNVGVRAGTTLTPSGSITVTTPGAVIDGRDVSGSITVSANNVTIKNTRVTMTSGGCGPTDACGNSDIHLTGPYSVTISNVELTSNSGITVDHGIRNSYGGHIFVDRVYQHGAVGALCWCGAADISDSYSIIHLDIATNHLENIYGTNETITINHNTLLNPVSQTANIFLNTANGSGGPCDNQATITNNLLAGGGYQLYPCGNASSVGSSTIDVENNRFARCLTSAVPGVSGSWNCSGGADSYGYFPSGGSYGTHSGVYCPPVSGQTWSGNKWDDRGSTIGC